MFIGKSKDGHPGSDPPKDYTNIHVILLFEAIHQSPLKIDYDNGNLSNLQIIKAK